jgi:RNA recognition motif-containing protein
LRPSRILYNLEGPLILEVKMAETRLYVGNLSFQVTEEDLKELFKEAGTVESVSVVTDRATGRSRGFAFVEMASEEEAKSAIEKFNGFSFKERDSSKHSQTSSRKKRF